MFGFGKKEKEDALTLRVGIILNKAGVPQNLSTTFVGAYPYWEELFELLGRKNEDAPSILMTWAVALYYLGELKEKGQEDAYATMVPAVMQVHDLMSYVQNKNALDSRQIFSGLEILDQRLGIREIALDMGDYMNALSESPLATELKEAGAI